MNFSKFLFIILFTYALSASASCPQLYPFEHEIIIKDTVELCNSFYVARYNNITKAVIFSAEILQPNKYQIERINNFHSDNRTQSKVSPRVYLNTGYDKGHMTPAGDSTNANEMFETFLMTNMTPQRPTLNRNSWRILEELVRKMAVSAGHSIHVITYAIYDTPTKTMNGIPIPLGYFKVVYLNTRVRVFYADNIDHAQVVESTITNFEQKIGFSIR